MFDWKKFYKDLRLMIYQYILPNEMNYIYQTCKDTDLTSKLIQRNYIIYWNNFNLVKKKKS